MTLGENMEIVRMQKKMSQADLAKLADVHQKNISKYENDGVIPSALVLKEIARALGVTTDFLLGSQSDTVIKDVKLLNFFKEIDNMPDNLKGSLVQVIEAYVQNYKAKQAYAE